MDFIEKVLERLREWAQKIIESILGPEGQAEAEPIPVPVDDSKYRR